MKEQFINYYALKIYAFILTYSFMSSLVHISLDLNAHFQWRIIYHIIPRKKWTCDNYFEAIHLLTIMFYINIALELFH